MEWQIVGSIFLGTQTIIPSLYAYIKGSQKKMHEQLNDQMFWITTLFHQNNIEGIVVTTYNWNI